ncbi:MAG: FG-GAP repeat domain-containing protein, partial [bacterium]
MGFAIGGLSSIDRCNRTIAQDGADSEPTLVTGDGYCLDGVRLRLETGTYGAANSTYRTEIESYSKITALGTAGNGPASWEVKTKSGLIYTYGDTADSRIEVNGSSTAKTWALASIRDRAGNRIDFKYLEDSSNGTYRPDEIAYATNTGAGISTAPYKVKFIYEVVTRPDPIYGFDFGKQTYVPWRVQRIEVQSNSVVVRSYSLSYEPGGGAGGRSRLASIQECAASLSDCLSATTFTWTNATAAFQAQQDPSQTVPAGLLVADLDGDGRDDLIYVSSATSGSGTWRIRKANASGGFDAEINTGLTNTNYTQAMVFEWDGDGKADILVPYSGGHWYVFRSNGSGFDTPFDTGYTATGAGTQVRMVDIDGDGRDDLVRLSSSGAATVFVRYRQTSNFAATETTLWSSGTSNLTFMTNPLAFMGARHRSLTRHPDFDGDRREDFVAGLS